VAVNVEWSAEAANPAPPAWFPSFPCLPAERGLGKGCRQVCSTRGCGADLGESPETEESAFFFF
jgi:hypothetical protein